MKLRRLACVLAILPILPAPVPRGVDNPDAWIGASILWTCFWVVVAILAAGGLKGPRDPRTP